MIEIDENSEDTFWTWATQWNDEDQMYYIRLEQMESGSCKTLFQLDYGRFKTHHEVSDYEETLGDPYEAARREMKVFEIRN
jgi:hypothetical protein